MLNIQPSTKQAWNPRRGLHTHKPTEHGRVKFILKHYQPVIEDEPQEHPGFSLQITFVN
jgi:hypothetical protein